MASIFESIKAFEQRVKQLGFEELQGRLDEFGCNRFSVLAFASDFVPGVSPLLRAASKLESSNPAERQQSCLQAATLPGSNPAKAATLPRAGSRPAVGSTCRL